MQETIYPLKAILETLTKYKDPDVKKRLIYNQSPVGGIASKWIILFFLMLPLIEYASIFNDTMFNILGIAQAIIFFIVFLSMVMILIFALTFINNTKVIRQITPSWNYYFPDIDLKWVLSSGATPYKNFFSFYAKTFKENLEGDLLKENLEKAFKQMEEENKELLEAINRDKN